MRDALALPPFLRPIDMLNTVWRLRGSTDKVIECFVAPTAATVHAVTVVFDCETFLNECYPDEASATSRALQVRDGLLKSGIWEVVGADPVSIRGRVAV